MKNMTGPVAGMVSDVLTNHSQVIAQNKAACQSKYGFKAKEGFFIPFLTPKQAANQMGVSVKTLERLRKNGGGPPFVKTGTKHIRYPIVALDEWTANELKKSLSMKCPYCNPL